MAAEDPVDLDSERNSILNYFDIVFTIIFGVEMLMKILALGFCLHKGAYLRDSWNCLDFVVVMSSIASLALSGLGVDVSVVRVLRVLRVLRPLRAVNRARKLKEVGQRESLRFLTPRAVALRCRCSNPPV